MSPESFEALSKLISLRQGAQRTAAGMVLCDGMRPADAARACGISRSAVGNTLAVCRKGIALAKVVAQ